MNLQIAAILSNGNRTSDQSITHYQMLHLETFNFATLSKAQVVSLIEDGTKVFVANANGKQIPCAINNKALVGGVVEQWVQGKEDGEWTDDILALPHLSDINGAVKVSRFTRRSQDD